MILVGMNPLVNLILIQFAATMLAAVRRSKWFSEISNLHGMRSLIFVNPFSQDSFRQAYGAGIRCPGIRCQILT